MEDAREVILVDDEGVLDVLKRHEGIDVGLGFAVVLGILLHREDVFDRMGEEKVETIPFERKEDPYCQYEDDRG